MPKIPFAAPALLEQAVALTENIQISTSADAIRFNDSIRVNFHLPEPAPAGGKRINVQYETQMGYAGFAYLHNAENGNYVVPAGERSLTREIRLASTPGSGDNYVTIIAEADGRQFRKQVNFLLSNQISELNMDSGIAGTLVANREAIATIVMQRPVAHEDKIFAITSSDAAITVPASVRVPVGQTRTTFPILARSMPNGHGWIQATGDSIRQLQFFIRGSDVFIHTGVQELMAGEEVQGRIILNDSAPQSGITFQLRHNADNLLTVPSSIRVAPGAREASFTLRANNNINASRDVRLSAEANNEIYTTSLTLLPFPTISSIALSPDRIPSHGDYIATVQLSSPVGSNGAEIRLSDEPRGILNLPASVQVESGQQQVIIEGQVDEIVTGTRQVVFTASLGNHSRQQGVSVVSHPINVSTDREVLRSGDSANLTVTLGTAAPQGGVRISLAPSRYQPNITLPDNITIAQGHTSATVRMTTQQINRSESFSIIAQTGQHEATSPPIQLLPYVGLQQLTIDEERVPIGTQFHITARLTRNAPLGGADVELGARTLGHTIAAFILPSQQTLHIPEGQREATAAFNLNGYSNSTISIVGEVNGEIKRAEIPFEFQPSVSSFHFSPENLSPGQQTRGTIRLSAAAPEGGTTIQLSGSHENSSTQGAITFNPAPPFTIPAGQREIQFDVTLAPWVSNGYLFSAWTEYTERQQAVSASLHVERSPVSLRLERNIIAVGDEIRVSVTPDRRGGNWEAMRVRLGSDARGGLIMPHIVDVPENSMAGDVTIRAVRASGAQPYKIIAIQGDLRAEIPLTVLERPRVSSVQFDPPSLMGGQDTDMTITLDNIPPTGGLAINLSSSDENILPVPQTIHFDEGQRAYHIRNISIPANAVYQGSRSIRVTATDPVANQTNTASLSVRAPDLSIAADRSEVQAGDRFNVTIRSHYAAPEGGINVGLNHNPFFEMPRSVTIPRGGKSISFPVTVNHEPSVSRKLRQTISIGSYDLFRDNLEYSPEHMQAALDILPSDALARIQVSDEPWRYTEPLTVTVDLDSPAPEGGTPIQLRLENSQGSGAYHILEENNNELTVPAGARSASISLSVNTPPRSDDDYLIIHAHSRGYEIQKQIAYDRPPEVTDLTFDLTLPVAEGVAGNYEAEPNSVIVAHATLNKPAEANTRLLITCSQGLICPESHPVIRGQQNTSFLVRTKADSGLGNPDDSYVNERFERVSIQINGTSPRSKIIRLHQRNLMLHMPRITFNEQEDGEGEIVLKLEPATQYPRHVELASSIPERIMVPEQVTFAAGETEKTIAFRYVAGPSVSGHITAATGEDSEQSPIIRIAPSVVVPQSLTVNVPEDRNYRFVELGSEIEAIVRLNHPAPRWGAEFGIICDGDLICPDSIAFLQGEQEKNITVQTIEAPEQDPDDYQHQTFSLLKITDLQIAEAVHQQVTLHTRPRNLTMHMPSAPVPSMGESTARLILFPSANFVRTVQLQSSHPDILQVPEEVTVPSGVESVEYTLQGGSVDGERSQPVTITGRTGQDTDTIQVAVLPLQLPDIAEQRFVPDRLVRGEYATGVVTLSEPAPVDMRIRIQPGNTLIAEPSILEIPVGQREATYRIICPPDSIIYGSRQNHTISANILRADDTTDGQLFTLLSVRPYRSVQFTTSPQTIEGEKDVTIGIRIDPPADEDGVQIQIGADPEGLIELPETIQFPHSRSEGTFRVRTRPVQAEQRVRLSLSGDSIEHDMTQQLTLRPGSVYVEEQQLGDDDGFIPGRDTDIQNPPVVEISPEAPTPDTALPPGEQKLTGVKLVQVRPTMRGGAVPFLVNDLKTQITPRALLDNQNSPAASVTCPNGTQFPSSGFSSSAILFRFPASGGTCEVGNSVSNNSEVAFTVTPFSASTAALAGANGWSVDKTELVFGFGAPINNTFNVSKAGVTYTVTLGVQGDTVIFAAPIRVTVNGFSQ